MSAEGDFFTVMTGDAGIAAIVGTRIYPNVLPDNVVFPAVAYRVVSRNDIGSNGCRQTRFQIDFYDSTFTQVVVFTDAVIALAEGRGDYRYSAGPDLYESEEQLHHRVVDVFVAH